MARLSFTLEQLGSLVAVAEHGSITAAAESLNLSQSAVTQQLRLLEKALGVGLVERIGRGVRVTGAGRILAASASAALQASRHVEEEARAAKSATLGTLHIGASHTAASYYLPRRLAAFIERHPLVEVNVEVGYTPQICRKVAIGALDCGLVEGSHEQSGLVDAVIAEDEVVALARSSHPLAGATLLDRDELARHRYLARDEASGTESVARQILGEA